MANHYRVWPIGGDPTNGTVLAAGSSFEARQIAARAWSTPMGLLMARKEDAPATVRDDGGFSQATIPAHPAPREPESLRDILGTILERAKVARSYRSTMVNIKDACIDDIIRTVERALAKGGTES